MRTMNSLLRPYDYYKLTHFHSHSHKPLLQSYSSQSISVPPRKDGNSKYWNHHALRATNNNQGDDGKKTRRTFLSMEEAGLVEISGLSVHERFLCRLTISSLNLLRVIAEQEGCEIEDLNAGRVCDWFLKDKLKREQDIGSAVLQWGEEEDDDDGGGGGGGFNFQL